MKKNTETTQEKEEKEEKKAEARSRINSVGRFLGAAMVVALLIWYCMHPTYYGDGSFSALFRIRRTYLVMLASAVLITLCVTPNLLPERWNRILSWIWFVASPFAVYFSLYYMNAKKNIISTFLP
jgi:magnesium-transporting ATPase (P-type)